MGARVAALTARGLVTEKAEGASTGGRPPTLLRFDADAGVVLAVAIGRSRTRLAICQPRRRDRRPTDIDLDGGVGPDDLMPDLVKRLEVLLAESGHRPAAILGVGLSLPAPSTSPRLQPRFADHEWLGRHRTGAVLPRSHRCAGCGRQ